MKKILFAFLLIPFLNIAVAQENSISISYFKDFVSYKHRAISDFHILKDRKLFNPNHHTVALYYNQKVLERIKVQTGLEYQCMDFLGISTGQFPGSSPLLVRNRTIAVPVIVNTYFSLKKFELALGAGILAYLPFFEDRLDLKGFSVFGLENEFMNSWTGQLNLAYHISKKAKLNLTSRYQNAKQTTIFLGFSNWASGLSLELGIN